MDAAEEADETEDTDELAGEPVQTSVGQLQA